ncbi:MAG: NAD(P)H-dependent oxidoreductase subunit E [Alphaproteobacteria bacterium]|nr:NAD(P)H-dependent oxidoreductase subunit E [Alphaproteobacteria bacterium]MBF0335053.1 NAD(P)H-dependent oxidoreductase subunit E [Alphaproteobacteria bacterium]
MTAIDELIAPFEKMPGGLLPALHAVQDALGFVPPEAIEPLARLFALSRAEVLGVVSFYRDFRDQPPPARRLRLCVSESCRAVDGDSLRQAAQGVAIEEVHCLGDCACSPAVELDGRLHGRMTPARLARLLAEGQP